MLAVRKIAPVPGVSFETIPDTPRPQRGEVLIEVAAAGICGSDMHVYDWGAEYDFMRDKLPVTLGHEFCGRVAAMGEGVSGFAEGDLVAPIPTMSCMQCTECASGFPRRCQHKRTLGLTRDGGFARYARVPALSCVRLSDDTDPELGALMEPLSVGENAAEVGEVGFGDIVLVLGPGTIGQAIARSASWRGAAKVVVVGLNDTARLEVARKVGATDTLDLASVGSLSEAFLRITGGKLADVVFEATGHPSSVGDGLKLLRPDGVLVAAGIHALPSSIDLTSLVRKRQQIRGAHASTRAGWNAVATRLVDHPDDVRPMVSLSLSLEDAQQGFQKLRTENLSKVILRPASQ
jgi:threonine dehydrogenase-like Zn-dependent dehydrogenase